MCLSTQAPHLYGTLCSFSPPLWRFYLLSVGKCIVWRFWFLFLCWLWQILRERGAEGGRESIWFCFMICRGGSVKFSLGFGGPCEWKGNSDGQESFWWESWRHRSDGNYKPGFIRAVILTVLGICKHVEGAKGELWTLCLWDQTACVWLWAPPLTSSLVTWG